MLKASVIILTVMLAYASIYSLTAFIAPRAVLKSTVNASIGKTLDEAQSAGYLGAITIVMRHLGGIALAEIIASFFILFAGFRKAQKWAWIGFLIVGCVGWLVGLIINIVIGDTTNLTLHIIGFVIFLVGLLLPVKQFFVKTQ